MISPLSKTHLSRYLVVTLLLLCAFPGLLQAQNKVSPQGVRIEAEMQANPEEVWEMLLEFDAYPDWNPYIRSIDGVAEKGKRLHIVIDGKEKTYDFKAKVLELVPQHAFAWGGSALFFFKARHYFEIIPMENGQLRFIQGESWGGLFGKSYGKKVYEEAAVNFEKMNKVMAEKLQK